MTDHQNLTADALTALPQPRRYPAGALGRAEALAGGDPDWMTAGDPQPAFKGEDAMLEARDAAYRVWRDTDPEKSSSVGQAFDAGWRAALSPVSPPTADGAGQ